MRQYLDGGRLPASFDYAQLEHGSLAVFLAAYRSRAPPTRSPRRERLLQEFPFAPIAEVYAAELAGR